MGSDLKKTVSTLLDPFGVTGLGKAVTGEEAALQPTFRRAKRDIAGVFSPEFPEFPTPAEEQEQASASKILDTEALARLTQQRRSLSLRRTGRRSLRIDRPASPSGIRAGMDSGIRII